MGDTEKAEATNQYFASVFTVENNEDFPITVVNAEELGPITNTREKALNKLMELNVVKSPGPDGLRPRVLKEGGSRDSGCISCDISKFLGFW